MVRGRPGEAEEGRKEAGLACACRRRGRGRLPRHHAEGLAEGVQLPAVRRKALGNQVQAVACVGAGPKVLHDVPAGERVGVEHNQDVPFGRRVGRPPGTARVADDVAAEADKHGVVLPGAGGEGDPAGPARVAGFEPGRGRARLTRPPAPPAPPPASEKALVVLLSAGASSAFAMLYFRTRGSSSKSLSPSWGVRA